MDHAIKMLVKLVFSNTGRGLAKDAILLSEAIRSLGHDVRVQPLTPQSSTIRYICEKWARTKARIPSTLAVSLINSVQKFSRRLLTKKTPNLDLIVHLENIHPDHLDRCCINWLIPNQEWFRSDRSHYLPDVDVILCKTHEAERAFSSLHSRVEYVGFSTPGAKRPKPLQLDLKDSNSIVHVAGSSQSKGTTPVIEAWMKHPEWPTLMIVADNPLVQRSLPKNIRLLSRTSDDELEQLWRKASLAVIPSEVEGYGQVLAEAMLAGTVVITTDAPPMNELVNPSRGYLVRWSGKKPSRLGTRYFVDIKDLENAIQEAFTASPQVIRTKAKKGHQWTADNYIAFENRLKQLLEPCEQRSDLDIIQNAQ